MEFLKKFQYSIFLFLLAFGIFTLGLVPTGAKLLHRCFVAPEEYDQALAVITEISSQSSGTNFISYPVYVTFSVENAQGQWEEQQAQLDRYDQNMEVGMELWVIYQKENPQLITEKGNQLRAFLLYTSFVMLGVFVGLMMTKPASPEIYVRPRRSLRERLERY